MKPYNLVFGILCTRGHPNHPGFWSTNPPINGEVELRLLPNHKFESFEYELDQTKPFFDTYVRGDWSEKDGGVLLIAKEWRTLIRNHPDKSPTWNTKFLSPKGSLLVWSGRTLGISHKKPYGLDWKTLIKRFPN